MKEKKKKKRKKVRRRTDRFSGCFLFFFAKPRPELPLFLFFLCILYSTMPLQAAFRSSSMLPADTMVSLGHPGRHQQRAPATQRRQQVRGD